MYICILFNIKYIHIYVCERERSRAFKSMGSRPRTESDLLDIRPRARYLNFMCLGFPSLKSGIKAPVSNHCCVKLMN